MNPPLAQNVQPPAFDEPVVSIGTPAEQTNTTASVDWSIPFYDTWIVFFAIALAFVLMFAVGTLYCMLRISYIRKKEKEAWDAEPPGLAMSMFLQGDDHAQSHIANTPQQSRWDMVLAHARSENENDRRHAILEADIMLGALLTERGYQGDTMSDQLKAVDPTDVNTVELAWEAHKIRNKYAHEGSDVPCSAQEARRVIGLYEQVFRELGYVE